MKTSHKEGFFSNLKSDLPSSIVVFLVALPLCLGIALASGAPLFSGIIAGIVGGVVVSLLSGSPLGVSGPAAGLAVIVLTSIQELGSFDVFLFTVIIAGALQILFSVLKAGVIAYYFPSAVIKGMLSGIGVIIILKQIPHAFGYDRDPEGDLAFSQVDGHNTLTELGYMLEAITPGALIIAAVSMAILILWEQPFMKKNSALKLVQGPLVAVLAGIGLNLFFQSNESMSLSSDHLVSIPVADSALDFFSLFSFPDFSQWQNPDLYFIAITIAIVASLETLLCVEATDKLDPKKRITPTNRELFAQGVGNMISGFVGGLPITQVIVRGSVNVQSGGKTKASAFFHGLLLLVSAMMIPRVLNLIPLASLAAILLMVGYKLAKPALFKEMYKLGMSQFIPFMVTIIGIVFTDLLVGIGLGLIVAIFQILWNNFRSPYHFDPNDYVKGKPIKIQLSEDVTFLNKASILRTLNNLPEACHVIVDASKTRNIHPDILEIIENAKLNAKLKGTTIELTGLDEQKENANSAKRFDEFMTEEATNNQKMST